MNKSIWRPDGFAIGLFGAGIILFILPLMQMPGLIAILLSVAYWLIMAIVKFAYLRSKRIPRA